MKLQFRLRTLMIVVTLLALPLGYVGWQAKIVRERQQMACRIATEDHGWVLSVGIPSPSERDISWTRRILGDYPVTGVLLPANTTAEERAVIRAAFPGVEVFGFVDNGKNWETIPFWDDAR